MVGATAKAQPTIDVVHPLLHGLLLAWPIWALLAAVFVGKIVLQLIKQEQLRRSGIFEIDLMGGTAFEQRLAVLFRDLGYRAEIVGSAGGDYGADLVVTKNGRRSVIQAKCWRKNVGIKAVQEAIGAKAYYDAHGAMVVTNRHFSSQARALAKKAGVSLCDRDQLVRMLRSVRAPESAVA